MKIPRFLSSALLGPICLLPGFSAPAPADKGVMTCICVAPGSSSDVRSVFHRTILKSNLERTKDRWGEHRMEPSAQRMTESDRRLWFEPATYQ